MTKRTQEEVSRTLVNFLNNLKSKELREYPLGELQSILNVLHYLYVETNLQKEKQTLREIYTKITDYYNSKAGKTYNKVMSETV